MSDAKGGSKWLSLAKLLGSCLVGATTAIAAIYPIAKDRGFVEGEKAAVTNLAVKFEMVLRNELVVQSPALRGIAEAVVSGIQKVDDKEPAQAFAQRQAAEWSRIIQQVDPRRYEPQVDNRAGGDWARPAGVIINFPRNRTTLICGGKHTVTYLGPHPRNDRLHYLKFDSANWLASQGDRRPFSGGSGANIVLTLVEVDPSGARILAKCE
jgi:hypothetical protein